MQKRPARTVLGFRRKQRRYPLERVVQNIALVLVRAPQSAELAGFFPGVGLASSRGEPELVGARRESHVMRRTRRISSLLLAGLLSVSGCTDNGENALPEEQVEPVKQGLTNDAASEADEATGEVEELEYYSGSMPGTVGVGTPSVAFANETRFIQSSGTTYAGFPAVNGVDYVNGAGATVHRTFLTTRLSADPCHTPDCSHSVKYMAESEATSSGEYVSNTTSGPLSLQNMVQLGNGHLYVVEEEVPSGVFYNTFGGALRAWKSTDRGATWATTPSNITVGSATTYDVMSGRGLWFHKGLIRVIDTSVTPPRSMLLASAYTSITTAAGVSDPENSKRVVLLQSIDDGANWTVRSFITGMPGTGTMTFNGVSTPYHVHNSESTLVQMPNGHLLAFWRVQRNRASDGKFMVYDYLKHARSTDLGLTWTTEYTFYTGASGSPTYYGAVSPLARVLPNGVTVLAFGHRGSPSGKLAGNANMLVYTSDPAGNLGTWLSAGSLHTNQLGNSYAINTDQYAEGSSGYMGLEVVDSNRLFAVFDNCAPGWGCNYATSGDTAQKVLGRYVNVLTPGSGKIDIAGKVQSGKFTVATNMTTAILESRAKGAFDGSTAYWSAAMANSAVTSPYLTITMDKTYNINRIGFAGQNGYTSGATTAASIYVSTDNVNWTLAWQPASKKYTTLDYYTLSAALPAKYVKVVPTASPYCHSLIGNNCAVIGELELYDNQTFSFENDAVSEVPRGFSRSLGNVTSEQPDGTRGYRLRDRSSTAQAWLRRDTGVMSLTKTFEFKVKALAMTSGLTFTVYGKATGGVEVAAYHLMMGTGSPAYFSRYTGSAWQQISGVAGVTPTAQNTIRLVVGASSATLYVNSQPGVVVSPSAAAGTFHKMQISSGGTAPAGEEFIIDDVIF